MVHCIIVGCGSKSGKHRVSFACIPKIVTNQGEEHEELTRERRRRWISAISRGDTDTKRVLDSERVCGLHFVSGRPAASWDRHNVDWVPSINLGKSESRNTDCKDKREAVEARAERAKERRKRTLQQQQIECEIKRKQLDQTGLTVKEIDFSSESQCSADCQGYTETTCSSSNERFSDEVVPKEVSTQTDEILTCEGFENAESQTEEFQYMFYQHVYQAPDKEYFQSTEKVRFYTGLPSFEELMILFDHVSPHVSRRSTALNTFQEFIIVLMKLRLNVPLQDLAYRFSVSLSTVSRIIATWMVAMDIRLSCFIRWPTREQLWKTMPMCFLYTFGRKVTVIIDCFEVFIDKPTNLLARAQTFSSYKHHNTIKVLIGITPQGTISFVSEAWGGRTSDKYLTENCGFLDNLNPGDTVMADRGFTVTESVGLKHGDLMIPAFTKGKSQLDPIDVERSRGIASVRIHVERVIGLLRRKYTILQSTLPTSYLDCDPNGPIETQVPMIDRILRVCSALVNWCPTIVPFD